MASSRRYGREISIIVLSLVDGGDRSVGDDVPPIPPIVSLLVPLWRLRPFGLFPLRIVRFQALLITIPILHIDTLSIKNVYRQYIRSCRQCEGRPGQFFRIVR